MKILLSQPNINFKIGIVQQRVEVEVAKRRKRTRTTTAIIITTVKPIMKMIVMKKVI